MKKSTAPKKSSFNPFWLEQGYDARFQVFQNLMRFRIRNILLVSSLYDLFLFEEDGRLYEQLREEYQGLNLSQAPELTRVSNGAEAIALAKLEKRFDLVIITLHIEDMSAHKFAELVKQSGLELPVVLLVNDDRELKGLRNQNQTSAFDGIFLWQGDFRIIIAIIKLYEDQINVDHDTRTIGVQSIILIEDSVRYYSSFLPIVYFEIFEQSQRLLSEGMNLSHKFLRMRARPKILLCTYYEEAWEYFCRYKDSILGVISDIDFKRKGKSDPRAGLIFTRSVKKQHPDIPILLQSNSPANEEKAHKAGASFLLKNSPTLLQDLRHFIFENFGFGDFVFRTREGNEVGRAGNLIALEKALSHVPEESIQYHSEGNHFSNWLKSRTEFWLAHQLRPRKVSDFPDLQALRENLIGSLRDYRLIRQRGIITDFSKETFYPLSSFARIGGGSLGGKTRGLSFMNKLIYNYKIHDMFEGVRVYTPPGVVIGTDVFDQFLDENNLHQFALKTDDDFEITRRFIEAQKFPEAISQQLRDFLKIVRVPLAVRSSSLLEDSLYQPFSGVYKTYMLPNNDENDDTRMFDLVNAIKRIYASTFYQNAKDYMAVTSFRLEEEKMAIIIQKLIGAEHDQRFYPDFSGIAKSHNFYPISPQKSSDGIACVALGLGKTVVEDGTSVKFSPKYPKHLPQFHNVAETLKTSQHEFYALPLNKDVAYENETEDILLEKYGLEIAEKDRTLTYVGSTYSQENDSIHDGISRSGSRLVTFAPILKQGLYPLAEILQNLLEIGTWGMGTSIEIEFAVNLSVEKNKPTEFALLQMRPFVLHQEVEALNLGETKKGDVICQSNQVMGNGIIDDIHDIVFVDKDRFSRSKSREVANEISQLNSRLVSEDTSYILIGVGRWGSLDPWLGIPVKWEQISGARVIVETGFKDLHVAPSQGTHFFHNLTSYMVGYFTVSGNDNEDWLDWNWLLTQPVTEEMRFTKHLQFKEPITIKMNGRKNKGIILKP